MLSQLQDLYELGSVPTGYVTHEVFAPVPGGGEPVPVSMLMLDIRRGRPADLRMAVAEALCKHCIDLLGLDRHRLNVEFTQHDGDEMYHPALGGYSPDWQPGEA